LLSAQIRVQSGHWSKDRLATSAASAKKEQSPTLRFMGLPGDEEVARLAELNDLPPILVYLERAVPQGGGYLVGSELTLADIAVAGPFANFRHTNTNVDPARYPRTAAYVERILARPSLAQWIECETAMLAMQPA